MLTNSKYNCEFGINMYGSQFILAQQDNLIELEHSVFNTDKPCHIYMITRRPRIMIEPSSVKIEGGLIYGQFLIQDGKEIIREDFALNNHIGSNLKFECPYPHTEYFFFDNTDTLVSNGKVALILQKLSKDYSKYLSLEVLYIGQSFGVDGVRSAPQRLQNHSTLQGIYAEAIKRTPDKEIWLVLWGFTPIVMAAIDGCSKDFEITEANDDRHIEQVYGEFISEQQLINFTEAALIRYFEPEYNILFKNSFPNPAHTTYSECYNLDIYSLHVELQTEKLNCQLYSPKVAPAWTHFASFGLHDFKDRKSILDAALPDLLTKQC